MIAQNRMIGMIAGVLLFYLSACFGNDSSNAESDDCSVCGKGLADFPPIPVVKGGRPIPSTKSFPWVVGVRPRNTSFHCAGAILDEYFILTAAHCVSSEGKVDKNMKVYFQTESAEQVSKAAVIENIAVHPRFEVLRSKLTFKQRAKNDIALIKLKEKVKCNKYRRSICLPKADYKPTDEIFYVAGWCNPDGIIGILQYGTLQNLRFEMCLKRNPDLKDIKDHTLCLGNTDQTVCSGDSGGPLMDKINGKYTVFGVASAVTSTDFEVEAPVLFTNVAVYVDWIEKEKRKLLKGSFLAYKGENVEEKKCPAKIYRK